MTTAATRPPFAEASPAEIRAALLDEEKPEFDREYEHALAVASESLTLDELHATLECWRRVAWMTYTSPEEHRRALLAAAERFTQTSVPAGESITATKARLGL